LFKQILFIYSFDKQNLEVLMSQPTYNIANIRNLLKTSFTVEELQQICYDEFMPVYDALPAAPSKDQIIQKLIEHCQLKGQMERLLAIVREKSPEAFAEAEESLVDETANLQALLKIAMAGESFRRRCQKEFGFGQSQDIPQLIEYCVKHRQLERLLSLIKADVYAGTYAKYEKSVRLEIDRLQAAESDEPLETSTPTDQSTTFIQPTPPPSGVTYPSSSLPHTPSNIILVVTVTKVEALAVLNVFSQAAGHKWSRQAIGNKTYYNLGVHGGAPVSMVQSEMGTATPGGALLTVRQAIQDLRPQAVIMCGIAFGLRPDKQQLGDILVARQLQYYEPQKVDIQRGQIPRGDKTMVSERLLDRFRSGDIEWPGAPTHFGLVLSGEKLVNDRAFRDWLLRAEPEAVGGEMEGAGLYAAARDAKVDWILVKAICDWADGTKNNAAQPQAANNAAQFVLHVLQLGGWGGPEQFASTLATSVEDKLSQPTGLTMPDETEHLKQLLIQKTRVLHELEMQAAMLGISTPPHVKLQIEDLETEIEQLKRNYSAYQVTGT
jgi:nucleoside phosphorylase